MAKVVNVLRQSVIITTASCRRYPSITLRSHCQAARGRSTRQNHGKSSYTNYILLGSSGGILGYFSSDSQQIGRIKKEIGTATMHLHQSEPQLAAKNFNAALELVQNDLDNRGRTSQKEIIFLIDQLGNIALQLERYSEAIELYKVTIEGLVAQGMCRSDRVITELALKIAQIYAILGDITNAELGFMTCIAVTNNQFAKSEGDLSAKEMEIFELACEGLGKLYLSAGQPKEAIKWYNHAISCTEKYSEGPRLAVLYRETAAVYESMGQLDEALKMIKLSEEKAATHTPLYTQRFSVKRAHLYARLGKQDEALRLYEELVKLSKERFDEEVLNEIELHLNKLSP